MIYLAGRARVDATVGVIYAKSSPGVLLPNGTLKTVGGFAFSAHGFMQDQQLYTGNVLLFPHGPNAGTFFNRRNAAHEIVHILTNAGHYGETGYPGPPPMNDFWKNRNLMRGEGYEAPEATNPLNRLNEEQERSILKNPKLQNP